MSQLLRLFPSVLILFEVFVNKNTCFTTGYLICLLLNIQRLGWYSAAAAPHYNALARLFPRLRMFAVDSASNHIINAQVCTRYLPIYQCC